MKWFIGSLVFLTLGPFCVLSEVQLVQSGPGVMRPGETLSVTCTVSFSDASKSIDNYVWGWIRQPPGKGLEWMGNIDPEHDSTVYAPAFQNRINFSSQSSANKLHLRLSSVTAADTATYYCASLAAYTVLDEDGVLISELGYAFDYWGKGTSVTVTSATATAPSVFPLSPCNQDMSSASQVSMACLVSGYFPQPAIVKWNSGAITSGIQDFPALLQPSSSLYLSSSQLTIQASKWLSESYQCNVAHAATSSAINKRIEPCSSREPRTPDVQLLHSSCSRKTDDSTVELVCFISGFYPNTVTVNWLVDGVSGVLAAHTESPKKDATGGTFSTTSTANVTQVAWKQGKIYTCQVIHQGTKVEKHASKCPGDSGACATNGVKMSVKPPTPADLYMNGDPKLICVISHLESDVGLRVSWTWEKAGALEPEPLETSSDSDGTFIAESTLIIPKQSWLAGNIYTCKAEHPSFVAPLSKPIKKNGGPRTRPHVYLFRPHNEELKSRDPNVCLTCLVKGFNPKEISIKWLENHNVVTEGSHVTTPVQLDSSQDSYFVYSKLTVPKANWNDGNSYTCHVVHEGLDMKYTQRTIERTLGKK